MKTALRFLFCLLALAVLLWFCTGILRANATTAALLLLLEVLAVAVLCGLREAVVISILAMAGLNYYFLPPIGTFTIADPKNWVALAVFLITAVTASKLSVEASKRAAEADRQRSEIQNLYSLSRDMLLNDSPATITDSMNRAAALFGIRRIAFYDLATRETTGGTDWDVPVRELLASVAAGGETVNGAEFSILPVRFGTKPIGSMVLEEGTLSPAIRESIANLLAINHERAEATDRALAAEAARRNEEFKSALLDGLAHDLKTPLTAIRTCVTQLIDFPPRRPETTAELLSIIDQESLRLQQTISEAVALARIESSKISMEIAEVSALELIHEALAGARDEDHARYQLHVDPAITLHADRELLRQALKQIFENAWKYTPSASPIEISVRQTPTAILIGIADQGPGIAPEETERIFQKFYRGRRNRGSAEGTGMGLAIARGIVEAHGGKVRAENRPQGGACFTVTMPRVETVRPVE